MTTRTVHFLSQNRPGPRMGMGHYERLLLHSLDTARRSLEGENWRFEITFRGRRPADIDASGVDISYDAFHFLGFSPQRLEKLPLAASQLVLNRALQTARPHATLFHSLALSFPAPSFAPAIYMIHDLPPAHFADEGRIAPYAKKVAQRAAAIATPSEFARQDLISLLDLQPERVHVVPYGCEHDRYHPDVAPLGSETLRELGLEGPFLLYAGGATRRKNVSALLQAWKAIAPRYPDLSLALAGPQRALNERVALSGAPRARAIGYVPFTRMPGLMKAARALVFPSIYEGFGLPPQEAMALGVPVIVSRAGGAVPEVVGEAGLYAEDGSAEALAEALHQFLTSPDEEQRMREAGPRQVAHSSWDQHARTMLSLYRQIASETL